METAFKGLMSFAVTYLVYYLGGGDFHRGWGLALATFIAFFLWGKSLVCDE